ncbi:MAG: TrkA family potassium uptake protein [Acholeplasmatales bacterium]|nr:TrkA family potassium uptake protein [Acholeplasmatales bacterium]
MKKKFFMVVGLGRFGSYIAKTLASMNAEILAIDNNIDTVQEMYKQIPNCVCCDSTNINALKELDLKNIDHALIAIGNNLQASILTVTNLKSLGVNKISVRADQESYKQIYKLLGATDVIIPEEASAISLANKVLSDTMLDYKELGGDYALVNVNVGINVDKTLMKLDLRNQFGVNIVGIQKQGNEDDFYIPRGTDKLDKGDVVVCVGKKSDIKKFDDFLNS